MKSITTFITFEGETEEAIDFYVSLFPNSRIVKMTHYGPDEAGETGTVKHVTFEINGEKFMAIDSYVEHKWDITPGLSLYIECDDEDELDEFFQELSHEGKVHMPLDDYGFSKKFGWVDDRFGVSWQLNLGPLKM